MVVHGIVDHLTRNVAHSTLEDHHDVGESRTARDAVGAPCTARWQLERCSLRVRAIVTGFGAWRLGVAPSHGTYPQL